MPKVKMPHISPLHQTAIVTSSYAGDVERFALLCETMDHFVAGHSRHLVLVASKDVKLFSRFAGPKREIIDEADILPFWLRRFSDPFSYFKRDIWLSPRTIPMRGWHVQQLRRMAIAQYISEDAYLSCDSDVAFVAPYDVGNNWKNGLLRLYRLDNALNAEDHQEHRLWSANAAKRLGLNNSNQHDYISTLIQWKTSSVRSMLEHIETISGRHWVASIGSDRSFSECMIYGRYVDDVLGGEGLFHDPNPSCHVYWNGPPLDKAGLTNFISGRKANQIAVGLQSFVGTSVDDIREVLELQRAG
ncbi:MAG: DUF6492 family protein [Notoacmeibacter sp.]